MDPLPPQADQPDRNPVFRTTHWSVVQAAGNLNSPDAHAALELLCKTYWHPLYCFVRRFGYSPEDSQDLTQSFLAKLIEKNQIGLADPDRGRFRTFLLRALKNFLHNEHEWNNAQKRGGGLTFVSIDTQAAEDGYAAEPVDQLSPEQIYERRWAQTLLTGVLCRLKREFSTTRVCDAKVTLRSSGDLNFEIIRIV